MNYEINFLILQSKTEELPALRQKVKELITRLGGKVTEEKEYAKRKLAYRIKKEGYGFHTVVRFEMQENLAQLKKELNLEEKVARYIIVRSEDLLSLSELEEKIKKASEEKTQLSQEELGKFLKEKAAPSAAGSEVGKAVQPETLEKERPILNQTPAPEEKPAETSQKDKVVQDKQEEAGQKDQPKEDGRSKKDDKLSIDELDKKLDEILNI